MTDIPRTIARRAVYGFTRNRDGAELVWLFPRGDNAPGGTQHVVAPRRDGRVDWDGAEYCDDMDSARRVFCAGHDRLHGVAPMAPRWSRPIRA